LAVGWTAGSRRQSLLLTGLNLGDAWKTVVFAVDGGDKVHDVRGDVADVDESDNPFEDGGSVIMLLFALDTES